MIRGTTNDGAARIRLGATLGSRDPPVVSSGRAFTSASGSPTAPLRPWCVTKTMLDLELDTAVSLIGKAIKD